MIERALSLSPVTASKLAPRYSFDIQLGSLNRVNHRRFGVPRLFVTTLFEIRQRSEI